MRLVVFARAVEEQRRALVGWSIALVALVWVEAALWPTIDGMANFDELLASYPEGLRNLFDVEAMTTGQGFMNAELYTLMLPILFIVFAIGRAARLSAGDEEQGYLDAVLSTPISRTRFLLENALAVVVGVVALGVVLGVAILTASAVFSLGIGVGSAAVGSVAMALLGIEFGCLGLALGAVTGRRALAAGGAGALAVASYVAFVVSQFQPDLSGLAGWTPMGQSLADGPLGVGLQQGYGWMAVVSVALVAVAVPLYRQRDILAH